ncbi:MAG: hypothetical protein ABI542_00130 [Gemmatimonadota bacterium]
MTDQFRTGLVTFLVMVTLSGCELQRLPQAQGGAAVVVPGSELTGAWRSKIQFDKGVLSGVTDLEFLYAYNVGGTMTESSNYDEAANSSPPAYGVWRKTGPRQFETRYVFYQTRAPGPADGEGAAGGWLPAGHGVLTEHITLSADGNSYTSTVHYDSFDKDGQPADGGGDATGAGTRITFDSL